MFLLVNNSKVRRMCDAKAFGLLPFITYGPPGCGKTLCVVEAVCQILLRNAKAKLLVCAPSDAACDVLAARIISTLQPSGQTTILRLNSYKRRQEEVLRREVVLPYCGRPHAVNSALYPAPSSAELGSFSLIICTTAMVGHLVALSRVKRGMFSHILVDESSQAMEPEVLIPFCLATEATKLGLVGDPQQLGPTVLNAQARELGLDRSLLNRLMTHPDLPYSRGDNRYIACLTKNYRSNDVLLRIPNQLFYGGILTCCVETQRCADLQDWSGFPNPEFQGLVFVGEDGKDYHPMDQPTFVNSAEANTVVVNVQSLICHGLKENDLGVVALFRGQVRLIRDKLRKVGLGAIRVGTCDDYQGQEERVVLISTVIANPYWLSAKTEENPIFGFVCGFVGDAKRFNVALSRAKDLAIVIGCPSFLRHFPDSWGAVLKYCGENDSYRGVPLEEGGRKRTDDEAELKLLLDGFPKISMTFLD